MKNQSRAINLAMAAVVLVIFPLLITISTLGANVALESTGAQSSVFGPLDMSQAIIGAWSIVAVAVVGSLIFALFRDQVHH
jgi:hypothetical protein